MTDATNENATVGAVAWSSSASGTARTIDCTPDFNEAQKFMRALDPGAADWCFRALTEPRNGDPGRKRNGSLATQRQTLERDAAEGCALFVVVNAGGQTTDAITRIRAVWLDLDGPPLEPALAAVRAAVPGLEPSIIVSSSPGKWHVYYCIDPDDPLPVAEFTPIQKRLIQLTGADKNVHDLPRVMRLPGTVNRKEAPHLVRIVAREHRRYGATLLRQLLEVPAPVLLLPGDAALDDAAPVEAASSPAPAPAPPPVPAAAPPPGNLSPYLERMAEVPRLELDKRRAALLADAAHAVASAPEGQRNATLNQRGYSLAGVTAPDGAPLFTDAEIREALEPAGLRCGLERGEIANALPYSIISGRLKPYTLKDRDPPPKASAGSTDIIRQQVDGDRPPGVFRPWSLVSAELGTVKNWIIEGLLAPGWLSVIWGKLGAGKTFCVLDAALSLACGLETWAGRRLRCTGPVLYLAAEDAEGVAERVRAWELHHERKVPDAFMHAGARVRLDAAGAAQIQAELERMPVNPSWLIVDTMARAGGFDEGNNTEAGEFIGRLDAIRGATGVAITLVGHPGHEGSRLRGAYAIPAAADVVMEVQRTGDGMAVYADSSDGRKLKNTTRTFAAEFRLESVELGYTDCFGEPVTAGVAVHTGQAAPVEGKPVPKAIMAAMQLVGSAWRCTEAEVSGGRPVLREVQLKAYIDGAGGSWGKFNTALRKLTEGGRLSPSPDGWLVVCPVWSAQLLLPLAIGDPVRHEAEQAAAQRQAHEQAIVAALEQVASIGADVPAARDGQQPAHKVLAPVLEQHGVTLTTGQFWGALERLKQTGRVVVVMVERDRKPRAVLRLAEHAGSP